MNFLEYAMKCRDSNSKMQRLVAKCILTIEKYRADRYEARLNRTQITVPWNPQEESALLQSIRERIAQLLPEEETADHGREQG